MCVETGVNSQYKCCCGCMNLNTATLLIGFLYVIVAILQAIST